VAAVAGALSTLRGPGVLDGFLLLHLIWPEPVEGAQVSIVPRGSGALGFTLKTPPGSGLG
jgi:hypothetical protein